MSHVITLYASYSRVSNFRFSQSHCEVVAQGYFNTVTARVGINQPILRSVDDRPPEANVRYAMLQPVGGANAKLIGCHSPKKKETRKESLFWSLSQRESVEVNQLNGKKSSMSNLRSVSCYHYII